MTYGQGIIEKLPSGRFRVRVPDGKGKYKSATFDTMKEAERMRAVLRVERPQTIVAMTVARYGERIIMRWKLAGKKSWDDDLSRWGKICEYAEWSEFSVDAVTRGAIKDLLIDMLAAETRYGTPYSPQSVKHCLNLIRGVFAAAVDNELIEVNPAIGIDPPKGSEVSNWTALTQRELESITGSPMLSAEQRAVFLFVSYTGLRQGECAALLWTDVRELDGDEPHLLVSKSWETSTKNNKARRVDLIPAAAEILRNWRATPREVRKGRRTFDAARVWGERYALGYDWGWRDKPDMKNGVCWLGARRRAGISRRVTFHHLRDTCASHLLTGTWGRAWTIAEVATLLGHGTTFVTERYARLLPGQLAKAAAATFHESTTPIRGQSSKTPEKQERTRAGSNGQPSA